MRRADVAARWAPTAWCTSEPGTREAAAVAKLPVVASQRYAITRYRVRLLVHDGSAARMTPGPAEQWVPVAEVARLPMPSPFRKVVERLLEQT